ncbi:hypothetical protein [Winogradskyella sp. SM1960]|uniref:hypothetical protein n=1 Tax=Winogradskyella sp. SM1960 TaxID=2865955 RepID=UPI001CD62421|nr:hypothetical protein [Winogradskyella sp. SM1960]
MTAEIKGTEKQTGINLFNSYLSKHQEFSKQTKVSDLYYHVNVVADAYGQGLKDGQNIGKQDFIDKIMKSTAEKFAEKANQVYILTKNTLSYIISKGYDVNSFYINIFHNNPKVIIAVDNKYLLDDDFVEFAYSKIFEAKNTFTSIFDNTLDISLAGTENLDIELLDQDGFEYSEVV